MLTESKAIANQAAGARRTATHLRSLAADTNAADRGVLLTAANIVETMANKTSKRAKIVAREEARYDAAYGAAQHAATAAANTLPRTTTLDQVALIYTGFYQASYLEKKLDTSTKAGELRNTMTNEVADAVREIATELAHKAAKNGKPIDDYRDELRARFAAYSINARVIRLAERFDAAVAQ